MLLPKCARVAATLSLLMKLLWMRTGLLAWNEQDERSTRDRVEKSTTEQTWASFHLLYLSHCSTRVLLFLFSSSDCLSFPLINSFSLNVSLFPSLSSLCFTQATLIALESNWLLLTDHLPRSNLRTDASFFVLSSLHPMDPLFPCLQLVLSHCALSRMSYSLGESIFNFLSFHQWQMPAVLAAFVSLLLWQSLGREGEREREAKKSSRL